MIAQTDILNRLYRAMIAQTDTGIINRLYRALIAQTDIINRLYRALIAQTDIINRLYRAIYYICLGYHSPVKSVYYMSGLS
jgi:hypothetical protein